MNLKCILVYHNGNIRYWGYGGFICCMIDTVNSFVACHKAAGAQGLSGQY